MAERSNPLPNAKPKLSRVIPIAHPTQGYPGPVYTTPKSPWLEANA